MNFPRLIKDLGRSVMRFSGSTRSWWSSVFNGNAVNYRRSAGDVSLSSIVAPCVNWVQRTLPEAPLVVYTWETKGGREVKKKLRTHRMQELLSRPNPYYGLSSLLAGTAADYIVTGNAYWLKRRFSESDERVAELWWIPSFMIKPASDENFIDYYVYTVDGIQYKVRREDVVHFRDGFDSHDPRVGRSSIASMIREIATDNEAASWEVSLLANMGVPGVIISAAEGSEIGAADAEEIKNLFSQNFTGANRGKPMVLSGPVQVRNVAFSPQQMNLRDTRRIPEERVSAAIGVPAVVVGLGAGLDRSTFNNMAEAREAAYEGCVIPMQRYLAEQIQLQLVPDFAEPGALEVEFDLAEVRVLQEDINKRHSRIREDVKSGIISLNEGRADLGYAPIEADVWYVAKTVVITDAPTPTLEPLALPAPTNVTKLPLASGE